MRGGKGEEKMEFRMLRKTILALAGTLLTMGAAYGAGTLGQVVPIGGAAADVALDEARGRLYVANFTANRIEVLSTATKTIQTSFNVAAQPNSVALSPDGRWLVVTHFGNRTAPSSPTNSLTLIDLKNSNARQTFALPNPPLGAAFGIDNKALVVTTKDFVLFDPAIGTTTVIDSFAEQATKAIPQPQQTFPPQITQGSVGASADGHYIWGFGDSLFFRYDVRQKRVVGSLFTAAPPLGPRGVSASNTGAQAAMGWVMADIDAENPRFYAKFADPLGDLAKGGHMIDSTRGLVYSEVPSAADDPARLTVRDLDNLALRETYHLPEHIAGRSALSSDGSTMYASSDSGVMILPMGKLSSTARVEASVEDLVFRGNFCDRNTATQSFIVRDPGGNKVPFSITSSNPGVRVSPSSGTTPAVVKVTIDPNAFATQVGTVAVDLTITSDTAVNVIKPVRVLVNSREPDQRGTFINVPGKLVDIVADPSKDQYYVLRQDTNQALVFDGSNNTLKATLRTCNKPRTMAITFDRRYLLVGCELAQIMSVFDLETLQPSTPVHTHNNNVLSMAVSARAILTNVHEELDSSHSIHAINFASRTDGKLPSLGVWENTTTENTVLTAASNGASVLVASSDGSVLLYDANVDTFTVSRKDSNSLGGAYAASSFGDYVIGNAIYNSSLVQTRTIQPSVGTSAGFAFVDQTGFFIGAPGAGSAGVIARVNPETGLGIRPTRTAESPILPSPESPFTRTVAPLYSRNTILILSISGVTVLPSGYDSAVAAPNVSRVVSAADGVSSVAPGGLFTIWGTNLNPTNVASKEIPLPTALGESCLTVNGQPVPILFVSPTQVNAQMPFQAVGNVTMIVHTPGGVSDNYNMTVLPNSPSVFRAELAPGAAFPTIVRHQNNMIATDSNPVHRGDVLVIYLTGMGKVSPLVENGRPAPYEPLAYTIDSPDVAIGGIGSPVLYSGLAPGQVGLYQINISVPSNTPKGLSVPLTIKQGGQTNTVNVRVVD